MIYSKSSSVVWRGRSRPTSKLRRQRHIGDFSGWNDRDKYDKAIERLLRDLQADR